MDIDFYEEIKAALSGKGRFLKDTTPDRADWSGPSTVVMLYDVAANSARSHFIEAMKKIIEDSKEDNRIIADAIRVSSALNLTDLDSSIRSVEKTSNDKYVVRAARTYVGLRNLALMTYTHPSSPL